MNLNTWIPLIVAIVLGLVAAIFARKLTTPPQAGVERPGDRVEVATARRLISPGEELGPDNIMLRPLSAKEAPEGTFPDASAVIGRVAVAPMVEGQPVLEACLAPQGTAGGIQALVPDGMRAISLEVNEFSGLSGMLIPGCYVDVISTLPDEGEQTMARTIVQNVQVTAVGQRLNPHEKTDADAPMSRAVTLLVTPQQAEKLELAAVTMRNSGAGLPWLVLRSPTDKLDHNARGVTLADLRGIDLRRPDRDPFATRPVADTASSPTTAPTAGLVAGPAPAARYREVTIIRAGVPSTVAIEDAPAPEAPALMTGAGLEYINK